MTDSQGAAKAAPSNTGILDWIRNIDIAKVAKVLGYLTAIEALIAHGDINLAGMSPATTDLVKTWCGNFVIINQAILVGHIGMAVKWPKPAMPNISSAAIVLLALMAAALAWPLPAHAGLFDPAGAPAVHAVAKKHVRHVHRIAAIPLPKLRPLFDAATLPVPKAASASAAKLSATQVQQNPLVLLENIATSDLQAALADAQAQTCPATAANATPQPCPDTVAANCYQALLNLKNNPALALPSGQVIGAFTAIQKGRDLKAMLANLASPTGPLANLNAACAAWTQDNVATLIAVGGAVGLVALPAGGATAAATGAVAAFNAQILGFLAAIPK